LSSASLNVLMVECGRAVGLKGEIRLKCHLEDITRLCDYNPYVDQQGKEYHITHFRILPAEPHMVVAKLQGITTRTQAEALNRLPLYIPRVRLGAIEDEETFFLADLIGLAVHDASGLVVGRISDVANYGAGDILEVAPTAGGPSAMVLFKEPFVCEVNLSDGYVVISDANLLDVGSTAVSPSSRHVKRKTRPSS
jgi:16S rRNA processing protein RimM